MFDRIIIGRGNARKVYVPQLGRDAASKDAEAISMYIHAGRLTAPRRRGFAHMQAAIAKRRADMGIGQ